MAWKWRDRTFGCILFFSFVGLGLIITPALLLKPKTPEQRELERFQGIWKIVAVELPPKYEEGRKSMKGDIFKVLENRVMIPIGHNKEIQMFSLHLDPTKHPKEIDISLGELRDDSQKQGLTALGIYELQEGMLTIALGTRDWRPTDFKPKEIEHGSYSMVVRLRRVNQD